MPVDVKDSNVDFAACSSYKWLMGDFGLGLLYARQDLLGHVRRIQFGTSQLKALRTHVYPFDSRGGGHLRGSSGRDRSLWNWHSSIIASGFLLRCLMV